MSYREFSRPPWEQKPITGGYPYHGFVYRDAGGVMRRRTPAGTVVATNQSMPNWDGFESQGFKNISWKIAKPGWSAPALPPAVAAAEEAAGRSWLGHGIITPPNRGFYDVSASPDVFWYYVSAAGDLVRVNVVHSPISASHVPVGIAGIAYHTVTAYQTIAGVPGSAQATYTASVDLAQTYDAASAEFDSAGDWYWTCVDMSDDGAVSVWVFNEAVAVLTLSGDAPSITASITAVSAKQYPDYRNMSHPLLTRSFSTSGEGISYDGFITDHNFGTTTDSKRVVRAVAHDGTLLFLETSQTFSGHEYSDSNSANLVVCDPGSPSTTDQPRWRVSSGTATAKWNGVTYTATETDGPGQYNYVQVNGPKWGPLVHLRALDVVYRSTQTCVANVIESSTVAGQDSYYKDHALSAYVGDLPTRAYAINPDNHELFIWPSGVIFL